MKCRIPISRRIAALVVALIYVATSSATIVHGASHAAPAPARAAVGVLGDDVLLTAGAAAHAAHCFLCCHGPAVALASAPAVLPVPSPVLETIAVVRAAEARSAFHAPLPSLRAPPFGS